MVPQRFIAWLSELELLNIVAAHGSGISVCEHVYVSCDVSEPIDAMFHEVKRKTSDTWVHRVMFYQGWVMIHEVGKWNAQITPPFSSLSV